MGWPPTGPKWSPAEHFKRSLPSVEEAWQDLLEDNRGILMCVKKDPSGDTESDTYRCTHLTFQEYFAAEQCVQDARASGDVAGHYSQTFGNNPQWLREVALMYTLVESQMQADRIVLRLEVNVLIHDSAQLGFLLKLGCMASLTLIIDRRVRRILLLLPVAPL